MPFSAFLSTIFSAGRLLLTRMDDRLKKHFPYYLLLAFLITFIILAFLSEGSVGGADDIAHYKFSRFAFKYPEFFLDPWGKPLFTILMAPFAQFGMMGVRAFNILLGLGAALLTYLTAKKLDYKFPLRPGDDFLIRLKMSKQGRLRVIFHQQILRKNDEKLMVNANITAVLTRSGRPIAPDILEEKFEADGIVMEEV